MNEPVQRGKSDSGFPRTDRLNVYQTDGGCPHRKCRKQTQCNTEFSLIFLFQFLCSSRWVFGFRLNTFYGKDRKNARNEASHP